MDLTQVPIGFGMALAQNERAMMAYAAMKEFQKQAVLTRARNVRSEKEMEQIVSGIAGNSGIV